MNGLQLQAEKRLAPLRESGVVKEVRATHAQIERVTTPQIHVFVECDEAELTEHQAEIAHRLRDLGARIDVKPVRTQD